jgi:hypothetical protein
MQHLTLITMFTNSEHFLGGSLNEHHDANYLFNNCLSYGNKEPMKELSAYCVACKSVKTTSAFQLMSTDSGRGMAYGQCPSCGGKIQRILGTPDNQARGEAQ